MTARRLLTTLAALPLLAAIPADARNADPLDGIARDYVKLSLEAGAREPEYVDAYYGPATWKAEAEAHPRSVPALIADARTLRQRAEAIPVAQLGAAQKGRRAFLVGQLRAAETRLEMHDGRKFAFADEARGLFGMAPALKPLPAYDATLRRIDKLVPGEGPLWQRVDAYRNRFMIPADRLEPVMRAAIAECRKRTMAHIPLPADESFTLELVKGKPWGGYNYYQGGDRSLIQVNTDLPVPISRAVDLGCHEGYPGHHVYNVLLEQTLAKAKGWQEFTVYPLYSPQSFLAEGSANFGIELAFPGREREEFERRVLFPLAGLDAGEAKRYAALDKAMQDLTGARFTIARDYLDGRIDRDAAIAMTQRYQLVSAARAAKAIEFDDHYRSYVINYGLGLDTVRAHVNGAGKSQAARWREMARILSGPTVPADLATHRRKVR